MANLRDQNLGLMGLAGLAVLLVLGALFMPLNVPEIGIQPPSGYDPHHLIIQPGPRVEETTLAGLSEQLSLLLPKQAVSVASVAREVEENQDLAVFEHLKLTGVIQTSADAMALVQDTSTGQLIDLSVGRSFGKWLVVEVAPDRLVFERGGRLVTLLLYDDRKLKTKEKPYLVSYKPVDGDPS